MTIREHMALQIATTRAPAARRARAHHELGMSPARHAQVVDALLDRPDVLEVAPAAVWRLRRVREMRALARTSVNMDTNPSLL